MKYSYLTLATSVLLYTTASAPQEDTGISGSGSGNGTDIEYPESKTPRLEIEAEKSGAQTPATGADKPEDSELETSGLDPKFKDE